MAGRRSTTCAQDASEGGSAWISAGVPPEQPRGRVGGVDPGGEDGGCRADRQCRRLHPYLDRHAGRAVGLPGPFGRGASVEYFRPRAVSPSFVHFQGGEGRDLRLRRDRLRACDRGAGRCDRGRRSRSDGGRKRDAAHDATRGQFRQGPDPRARGAARGDRSDRDRGRA